jgi:hypothetical protein
MHTFWEFYWIDSILCFVFLSKKKLFTCKITFHYIKVIEVIPIFLKCFLYSIYIVHSHPEVRELMLWCSNFLDDLCILDRVSNYVAVWYPLIFGQSLCLMELVVIGGCVYRCLSLCVLRVTFNIMISDFTNKCFI